MININEKGSGFDYFIRLTELITRDAKELKALLLYKDMRMIEVNKVRALADIDCSIANLIELRQYFKESELEKR